ncbi:MULTISPECIES: hypothetical protein [Wolbachia]|nr:MULTISPECIES: hypothetical protein [Wolbachia]MBA8758595.1 hypothetical protein [Wolbachia pipientis]MBA8770123.1 hypothetical protein [Wolbachia pipientis]MCE4150014.1 hypothetical protein [Wolbachia endosymbiont of Drosophila melanogaster]UJC71461.1 hypothetical protein L1L77_02430 [Wolbachia endosymbiont of Aedes aegypti]
MQPELSVQLCKHRDLSPPEGCHPSAQTLGSRNFIKLVSIKVAVLC